MTNEYQKQKSKYRFAIEFLTLEKISLQEIYDRVQKNIKPCVAKCPQEMQQLQEKNVFVEKQNSNILFPVSN